MKNYRDDPRWQQAQQAYTAEGDGDHLVPQTAAAIGMYLVEAETEGAPITSEQWLLVKRLFTLAQSEHPQDEPSSAQSA